MHEKWIASGAMRRPSRASDDQSEMLFSSVDEIGADLFSLAMGTATGFIWISEQEEPARVTWLSWTGWTTREEIRRAFRELQSGPGRSVEVFLFGNLFNKEGQGSAEPLKGSVHRLPREQVKLLYQSLFN